MTQAKASILFSTMLFVMFLSMFILSTQFSPRAMYFPFAITLLGTIATLINTVLELVKYRKVKSNREEEERIENEYDTPIYYNTIVALKNFLWVIFYLVFIFLVGFIPATTIFLLVFLKFRTDFNWFKIFLSIAITIGLIIYGGNAMGLHWPTGLLF